MYIAIPRTVAQTSALSTAGMRARRRSTSGSAARSCWPPQNTRKTTARAKRTSVCVALQPQPLPSAIAISRALRPTVRVATPGRSSLAGGRPAVEETKTQESAKASAATTAPNQKAAERSIPASRPEIG